MRNAIILLCGRVQIFCKAGKGELAIKFETVWVILKSTVNLRVQTSYNRGVQTKTVEVKYSGFDES